MKYEKTITYKTNVRTETSFSASPWENVEMELSVNVNTDDSYGWFELYDVEHGGERYYAEGGLWFDCKTLTDYDGIFELPEKIIEILKEWGFDLTEIQ